MTTSRWQKGASEIESLIAGKRLQEVTGAAADGHPHLDKAKRTLETARDIARTDPESSLTLSYDAGRFVATGLLAQQGLRPTQEGGHVVVVEAMRHQFGARFAVLGTLKRRRNELQYPTVPGDVPGSSEAEEATNDVSELLNAAHELIDNLGFFKA